MRNIKNSKRYIDYEDLIKLDDEQKILVSRIIINNKFAKMQLFVNAQLSEKFDLSELKKITDIHSKLCDADENKKRPVWGIELTVKEIKEVFSKEDVSKSRTDFSLPFNHKENKPKKKNPMDLNTGEELYEYLKDKTDEEIEDYFVSRGAVIEDGIMLNNGLATLYRIEKDSVEKQYDNKEVSPFDGEDDGLER